MVKASYKIRSTKELLQAIQNRTQAKNNKTLPTKDENFDEGDDVIDSSMLSLLTFPPTVSDVSFAGIINELPTIGDVYSFTKSE